MRDDRFVGGSLLPSRVGQKTLGFKSAVIVAGNDRGAVMAGVLANQDRGTGHMDLLFLCTSFLDCVQLCFHCTADFFTTGN